MPRIARAVASGYPHHITQRGNNRDVVFFDNEDKKQYLILLEKYVIIFGLDGLSARRIL